MASSPRSWCRRTGWGWLRQSFFGGVSAASVVGVPLASFIATLAGWRHAFLAVALLSLAAAAVLCSTLPALAASIPVRLGVYRDIFRNPLLCGLYGATACIITAHFAAFTYVEPLLITLQGVPATALSGLLLLVRGFRAGG